ncbi:MAG TPA: alpha-D-glucose phosphate-specific phosphoglucomutase [Dongiaceae bacterium]|nr:alpha-D-glucose phosphate-specific phosphoglucomutase [Dongiaceae bacterium]
MDSIQTVATQPFKDQKPGTSGLRKKVRVFQQPHYLENFVQSIVNALPEQQRQRLVLGGDGRYYNREAIQTILEILVANGVGEVLVGEDGILSTPAVSNMIRQSKADGGIVLSASHNPGGPDEDFGIKFNNASGAPAPETLTERIYQETLGISQYQRWPLPAIELKAGREYRFGKTLIRILDSVDDYAALMTQLFDFDRLRSAIRQGKVSLTFDAMHAVTGPYGRRIFHDMLDLPSYLLKNVSPLPDFGGGHPDPNRVHAHDLWETMMGDSAPDLGAASDGDGDRNMIMGRHAFVSPSDSLALIAEHYRCIPQFRSGLAGVARSMPTSTAIDRVARHLKIPCFETPTGWKFFGNLLDAGKVRLCGEESFGTSGDHVREKDGVWAVLCWLSILVETGLPVEELLLRHWHAFGRSHYCRHDYEGLDAGGADAVLQGLLAQSDSLRGTTWDSACITTVDSFTYEDPVDGSVSRNQGVRLLFDNGSRIIYRLSGTGTGSATLRVYLEQLEQRREYLALDSIEHNRKLGQFAHQVSRIEGLTGAKQPSVIT